MSEQTSPESRDMAAWLAANALLSSDNDEPIGYYPRSSQAPTPLVTASRDVLVAGLHALSHRPHDSVPCMSTPGDERACYRRAQADADALLASGVVRAVDGLAEDEALVERVRAGIDSADEEAVERSGSDYVTASPREQARAAIRALAAALATPTDPSEA